MGAASKVFGAVAKMAGKTTAQAVGVGYGAATAVAKVGVGVAHDSYKLMGKVFEKNVGGFWEGTLRHGNILPFHTKGAVGLAVFGGGAAVGITKGLTGKDSPEATLERIDNDPSIQQADIPNTLNRMLSPNYGQKVDNLGADPGLAEAIYRNR